MGNIAPPLLLPGSPRGTRLYNSWINLQFSLTLDFWDVRLHQITRSFHFSKPVLPSASGVRNPLQ